MKTQLYALALAGVLLAASSVQAAPARDVEAFVNQTRMQVDHSLGDAGFSLNGRPMAVRLFIDANGHLSSPSIVRSSGSAGTDAAVTDALRKVTVRAPLDLIGAQVTVGLGNAPGAAAD